MSNIKFLPGATQPADTPVPATIALLEALLEAAKRGDVRSVAVAWTDNTPEVLTATAHNNEHYKLQGAVVQLLHRMCE